MNDTPTIFTLVELEWHESNYGYRGTFSTLERAQAAGDTLMSAMKGRRQNDWERLRCKETGLVAWWCNFSDHYHEFWVFPGTMDTPVNPDKVYGDDWEPYPLDDTGDPTG